MDDLQPKRVRSAFALHIALTILTVASAIVTILTVRAWPLAALFAAGMAFAEWRLYRVAARDKDHEFSSETSHKFVDFFAEWYSRPGDHFIFCKDLDWLDPAELAEVRAAIRRRHECTTIFVARDTAACVSEFREAGVTVHCIPNELAESRVKMSLNVDSEYERLIVRKKTARGGLRFIETSDRHTVAIARTLIRACLAISRDDREAPHA